MATVSRARQWNPVWLGVTLVAVVAVAAALIFLSRPAPKQPTGPSAAALAYLPYLHIADVKMNAAENLVQQQVVYVNGVLQNSGNRRLERVDVYCIFSGIDGKEIYRERVSLLRASGKPLGPGQSRPFQLPFDEIPDGWNQTPPRLQIAQIRFAT